MRWSSGEVRPKKNQYKRLHTFRTNLVLRMLVTSSSLREVVVLVSLQPASIEHHSIIIALQ